jgi:hypothetical protein
MDDFDDRDTSGCSLLGLTLAAVISALGWLLIVLAVRWVLGLPAPALLRLGAVVGLFAGTGMVFWSLVRVELLVLPSPDPRRGRRPAGYAAPPCVARDARTGLPLAGGRALRGARS